MVRTEFDMFDLFCWNLLFPIGLNSSDAIILMSLVSKTRSNATTLQKWHDMVTPTHTLGFYIYTAPHLQQADC